MNFLKGIGEHIGTGLKSVRDAERARLAAPALRQRHQEMMMDFAKVREIENPDDLRMAMGELEKKYPSLIPLKEKLSKVAYQKQAVTQDPSEYLVPAAVDIGKIQTARDKFEDMPEDLAAYFDAATKSVMDRVGFKEPEINPKTGKPRKIFDMSGKVIGTLNVDGTTTTPEGKVVDNRDLFSGGTIPSKTPSGKKGRVKDISDYFQDSTETIPEKNIPATFEQLGVMSPQDQATFQEIQDAVPDIDLRKEYENDAEGMQKLIKLWREKKLNKSNLHKAFSAIQQKAKESLMLA